MADLGQPGDGATSVAKANARAGSSRHGQIGCALPGLQDAERGFGQDAANIVIRRAHLYAGRSGNVAHNAVPDVGLHRPRLFDRQAVRRQLCTDGHAHALKLMT